MYGTIAKVKVNPSKIAELQAVGDSLGKPAGQVARYIFQADANPGEVWLVGVFESREAYWANANSPEQHERFMQIRALVESDPEWHDGEIISAMS